MLQNSITQNVYSYVCYRPNSITQNVVSHLCYINSITQNMCSHVSTQTVSQNMCSHVCYRTNTITENVCSHVCYRTNTITENVCSHVSKRYTHARHRSCRISCSRCPCVPCSFCIPRPPPAGRSLAWDPHTPWARLVADQTRHRPTFLFFTRKHVSMGPTTFAPSRQRRVFSAGKRNTHKEKTAFTLSEQMTFTLSGQTTCHFTVKRTLH